MNNEYLHHYTDIMALASILKNRTIRFSSLDKMDDLQEEKTADLKNIGQFCYVSSWTDDMEESIPMWNMYTNMEMGVRLSLIRDPFMTYENPVADLESVFNGPIRVETKGQSIKSKIPIAEMISQHFFSRELLGEKNFLNKVQYTDDQEKLYPRMVHRDDQKLSIALGILGKYKNQHWDFQKEWRYIFVALPLTLNPLKRSYKNMQVVMSRILQGVENQPFPFYDLRLSDEAFSSMKITLSPRINTDSRIIVENLIESYNPSIQIESSSLEGLI